MHELSLCQALLAEIEHAARGVHAGPLARIILRIGPLSGVEPALLQRAFEIARAGGLAADADLVLEPAPLRVQCLRCGAESDASPSRLRCAHCGAPRTRVVSGDELILQRLEFRGLVAAPGPEERAPCATPAAAM